MAEVSQEDVKELLFGSGEDQMNLTSIRIRVEDLLNRVETVLACLSSGSPLEAKWKTGLDAYSLVTVHLQRLLQSALPQMRRYIVCPVHFDPELTALSDLLATQLHQEQETAQQAVAEEMRRDEEELDRAVRRIDERNELIMDLIQVSRKPGSGLLDPKGPRKKRRLAKAAEIRHEIRQFNEQQQWKPVVEGSKQPKRLAVVPPDTTSGFGVLTNALLFGQGLRSEET